MLNSLKLWGLLISCSVLATATASGQTGPQPPDNHPQAPSFLTIPVIGEVVGQPVARITASTAVVLRSTGSQGTLKWITTPKAAAEHLTKIQTGSGEQGVMFSWPGHPEVEVILIATDGVIIVETRYIIPVDGGPGPDPTPPIPGPDPPPEPDPPIVSITEVVIVFESDAKLPGGRTPAQAVVMMDKGWEKYLDAQGVDARRLDRNQLPARLQPLADKAAAGPVVCFIGSGGADALCVPLPDSIEGLAKLVKEKVQ